MKALVTGATGFVGKPLVEHWQKAGWTLVLPVRNSARLAFLASSTVEIVEWDIGGSERPDPKWFIGVDVVVHLAALVAYTAPIDALRRVNVEGTRRLLDVAKKSGVRRFVYASSIESVGPVCHPDKPATSKTLCGPVSTYGQSKAEAEAIVSAASVSGFETCILRIGNVFGAGHDNFVIDIANAVRQHGRAAELLPVYRDRRVQPAYLPDLVAGIDRAARSHEQGIFTVAGPAVSLGELFSICADQVGARVSERSAKLHEQIFVLARTSYHRHKGFMDMITYFMTPPIWRKHRSCDVEEASRRLQLPKATPLSEAVGETLRWASKQPNWENDL